MIRDMKPPLTAADKEMIAALEEAARDMPAFSPHVRNRHGRISLNSPLIEQAIPSLDEPLPMNTDAALLARKLMSIAAQIEAGSTLEPGMAVPLRDAAGLLKTARWSQRGRPPLRRTKVLAELARRWREAGIPGKSSASERMLAFSARYIRRLLHRGGT
jgi:hypothetical protein